MNKKKDDKLELALQEHLKNRNNQKFVYRNEFFFPLLDENNKTLDKIKVKGDIDKIKYHNLIKNYSNSNI
jgi:hypothetical protein